MAESIAGPASTDNATVILWAVSFLLLIVGVLARILYGMIQNNARKCEEREAANQAEIKGLYQGVITEQRNTQVQSNAAINKMADAVSDLSQAMREGREDEETRQYRRRS